MKIVSIVWFMEKVNLAAINYFNYANSQSQILNIPYYCYLWLDKKFARLRTHTCIVQFSYVIFTKHNN